MSSPSGVVCDAVVTCHVGTGNNVCPPGAMHAHPAAETRAARRSSVVSARVTGGSPSPPGHPCRLRAPLSASKPSRKTRWDVGQRSPRQLAPRADPWACDPSRPGRARRMGLPLRGGSLSPAARRLERPDGACTPGPFCAAPRLPRALGRPRDARARARKRRPTPPARSSSSCLATRPSGDHRGGQLHRRGPACAGGVPSVASAARRPPRRRRVPRTPRSFTRCGRCHRCPNDGAALQCRSGSCRPHYTLHSHLGRWGCPKGRRTAERRGAGKRCGQLPAIRRRGKRGQRGGWGRGGKGCR